MWVLVLVWMGSMIFPGFLITTRWYEWRIRRGYATDAFYDAFFAIGLPLNVVWPLVPLVAAIEYVARENMDKLDRLSDGLVRTVDRLFPREGIR